MIRIIKLSKPEVKLSDLWDTGELELRTGKMFSANETDIPVYRIFVAV
jgi:hypothetical protein